MYLMADSRSRLGLGVEVVEGDRHRQALIDGLIKTMEKTNAVPGEIRVRRYSEEELLQPLASRLNVPVRRKRLPALDDLLESLMSHLRG